MLQTQRPCKHSPRGSFRNTSTSARGRRLAAAAPAGIWAGPLQGHRQLHGSRQAGGCAAEWPASHLQHHIRPQVTRGCQRLLRVGALSHRIVMQDLDEASPLPHQPPVEAPEVFPLLRTMPDYQRLNWSTIRKVRCQTHSCTSRLLMRLGVPRCCA